MNREDMQDVAASSYRAGWAAGWDAACKSLQPREQEPEPTRFSLLGDVAAVDEAIRQYRLAAAGLLPEK